MRPQLFVVLQLVLMSMPVLCATTASSCTGWPEVPVKRFFTVDGERQPLRIESSLRVGHNITSNILKILLDEVLSYDDVEIVQRDDSFNTSIAYDSLRPTHYSNGKSDVNVNLEVWVTNDFKILRYDRVLDQGLIAPPGRFAWLVALSPSSTPDSIHWTTFKDQEKVVQYDVTWEELRKVLTKDKLTNPSTGQYYCSHAKCVEGMYTPKQCQSPRHKHTPCALLLAGHFDATKPVMDHINKLGLYVRILWLGPNLQATSSQLLERQRESNRTVMVLTWSPSVVSQSRVWTPVVFPPCDGTNFTSPGCFYESRKRLKLVSETVDETEAQLVIDDMQLEKEQYEWLVGQAALDPTRSHRDIACTWLRENNNTWSHWLLPETAVSYAIVGIFPMSGPMSFASTTSEAAQKAVEAVNRDGSILPNMELEMSPHDGMCNKEAVMNRYISNVLHADYRKIIGIVGPACSDTVEPIVGISKYFKTVVISYSAEGSFFSNRSKFPYFFRTIGENQQFNHVYLNLMKELGWKRISSLTEDGQKYTEYLPHLVQLLNKHNLTFVVNSEFPGDNHTMKLNLIDLKNKRARIIVADVNDNAARTVMCTAYHMEMTAYQGYVWFLPQWLDFKWYDTDTHNKLSHDKVDCTTEQMIKAINGYFSLAHAAFAADDQMMQENITVGAWKKKFQTNTTNGSLSHYDGYAYDAVWVYAYALDKLHKNNSAYLADIHSSNTTERFVEYIQETDFYGVSGHIKFGTGASRKTVVNILQWVDNKSSIVGTYFPDTMDCTTETCKFRLNESAVVWLTPDGKRPDDGEEGCFLYSLATLLNVECSVAIAIANVIGFAMFGILVMVLFLVLKHRYDQKMAKMQQQQKYIKSLGFDLLETNMSDMDKWEIPRDRVVINRKLGQGAFGSVYGGEANFPDVGWVAVAVKTLKVNSTTEQKLDFLSEAEVMKRFEHKNIVKLLGVCTKDEPVYTVMEFMLYGDLKTFLLGRRHLVHNRKAGHEEAEDVSSKKLTSMALDIARGLSYLAQIKYVHRDLACRNCLVNNARTVKIGDFGMTRPMFENDYYKFNRKGMMPVRWMAPESLAFGIFTPASDMWSFGVVLYEIITFGSFPFQGLSNNQVMEFVKQGNTITIPSTVKPQLEFLIKSCWNSEHKKRPHASEMVEFLANNQRLLCPCLDVPLSSVELEDTGQFELNLPDKQRKFSMTLSTSEVARQRSMSHDSEPCPSPQPLDLDGTVFFANESRVPLLRQHSAAPTIVPTEQVECTSVL